MTYLSTTTKARLQAQLAKKEAQLALLEASYTAAVANSEISAYEFDAGDARQRATRRNPASIRAEITALEAEIEALYRRLSGMGIINFRMAR